MLPFLSSETPSIQIQACQALSSLLPMIIERGRSDPLLLLKMVLKIVEVLFDESDKVRCAASSLVHRLCLARCVHAHAGLISQAALESLLDVLLASLGSLTFISICIHLLVGQDIDALRDYWEERDCVFQSGRSMAFSEPLIVAQHLIRRIRSELRQSDPDKISSCLLPQLVSQWEQYVAELNEKTRHIGQLQLATLVDDQAFLELVLPVAAVARMFPALAEGRAPDERLMQLFIERNAFST
jgi:hypothetical protein